jgi:aminopeptidase-like protein
MVGAPGATFLMEGISMNYAPAIVRHVWSEAETAGYSNYFIQDEGIYVTDDHLYVNRILKIPTIDIIHQDRTSPTGFYPYWHTTKDNLQSIDKSTLGAVGQTLLTVIYDER